MITTIKSIVGRKIVARDGVVGEIKDVLFDDRDWHIRYIEVDTSGWLPCKRVLVSPRVFAEGCLGSDGYLGLNLTKQQVRESPSAERFPALSNRVNQRLYSIYGASAWGGESVMVYETAADGGSLAEDYWRKFAAAGKAEQRCHLRSCMEVLRYALAESKGEAVGWLMDMVVDDYDWAIADLVFDRSHWFTGNDKRVLSPLFVRQMDPVGKKVQLDLPQDVISNSPTFDLPRYRLVFQTTVAASKRLPHKPSVGKAVAAS